MRGNGWGVQICTSFLDHTLKTELLQDIKEIVCSFEELQPAQQAFPREFVENVGTRAKKRNDVGGGGERRKRLPANPMILKNCVCPRTQLLIGAVLVVLITQHSKHQSNQVCFVYVRRRSGLILFVVADCKCFGLIFESCLCKGLSNMSLFDQKYNWRSSSGDQ